MPSYPYQCTHCGFTAQYTHPHAEKLKTACSQCGGIMQKMLNTQVTIQTTKHLPPPSEHSQEEHCQHHPGCGHHHHSSDSKDGTAGGCVMGDKTWDEFVEWLEQPEPLTEASKIEPESNPKSKHQNS